MDFLFGGVKRRNQFKSSRSVGRSVGNRSVNFARGGTSYPGDATVRSADPYGGGSARQLYEDSMSVAPSVAPSAYSGARRRPPRWNRQQQPGPQPQFRRDFGNGPLPASYEADEQGFHDSRPYHDLPPPSSHERMSMPMPAAGRFPRRGTVDTDTMDDIMLQGGYPRRGSTMDRESSFRNRRGDGRTGSADDLVGMLSRAKHSRRDMGVSERETIEDMMEVMSNQSEALPSRFPRYRTGSADDSHYPHPHGAGDLEVDFRPREGGMQHSRSNRDLEVDFQQPQPHPEPPLQSSRIYYDPPEPSVVSEQDPYPKVNIYEQAAPSIYPQSQRFGGMGNNNSFDHQEQQRPPPPVDNRADLPGYSNKRRNAPSVASVSTGQSPRRVLTYIPDESGKPYYDALFREANMSGAQRSRDISADEVFEFLSLSRVPNDRLRIILTMANNDRSPRIDKEKFNVAVRLIQLYQNNQMVRNLNLTIDGNITIKPPFFYGISGVKVPLPRTTEKEDDEDEYEDRLPLKPKPKPKASILKKSSRKINTIDNSEGSGSYRYKDDDDEQYQQLQRNQYPPPQNGQYPPQQSQYQQPQQNDPPQQSQYQQPQQNDPPQQSQYPPQPNNEYPPQQNQYPQQQSDQYPPEQNQHQPQQSDQYPPEQNQHQPQQSDQYPPEQNQHQPQQSDQYPPEQNQHQPQQSDQYQPQQNQHQPQQSDQYPQQQNDKYQEHLHPTYDQAQQEQYDQHPGQYPNPNTNPTANYPSQTQNQAQYSMPPNEQQHQQQYQGHQSPQYPNQNSNVNYPPQAQNKAQYDMPPDEPHQQQFQGHQPPQYPNQNPNPQHQPPQEQYNQPQQFSNSPNPNTNNIPQPQNQAQFNSSPNEPNPQPYQGQQPNEDPYYQQQEQPSSPPPPIHQFHAYDRQQQPPKPSKSNEEERSHEVESLTPDKAANASRTSSPSALSYEGEKIPGPDKSKTVEEYNEDPYFLAAEEVERYEKIFPLYETDERKDEELNGPKHLCAFSKTDLEEWQIHLIWYMTVGDHITDTLSKSEFTIAIHLITCVTEKQLPIPSTLPTSLVKFKEREEKNKEHKEEENKTVDNHQKQLGDMKSEILSLKKELDSTKLLKEQFAAEQMKCAKVQSELDETKVELQNALKNVKNYNEKEIEIGAIRQELENTKMELETMQLSRENNMSSPQYEYGPSPAVPPSQDASQENSARPSNYDNSHEPSSLNSSRPSQNNFGPPSNIPPENDFEGISRLSDEFQSFRISQSQSQPQHSNNENIYNNMPNVIPAPNSYDPSFVSQTNNDFKESRMPGQIDNEIDPRNQPFGQTNFNSSVPIFE